MAISNDLYLAILAMDSYNRGYSPGLNLAAASQTQIGDATLGINSSILTNPGGGASLDEPVSFYAQSYTFNGQKVISYRGTDDILKDALYGWLTGAGSSADPARA
jgi:hypothetical protein